MGDGKGCPAVLRFSGLPCRTLSEDRRVSRTGNVAGPLAKSPDGQYIIAGQESRDLRFLRSTDGGSLSADCRQRPKTGANNA